MGGNRKHKPTSSCTYTHTHNTFLNNARRQKHCPFAPKGWFTVLFCLQELVDEVHDSEERDESLSGCRVTVVVVGEMRPCCWQCGVFLPLLQKLNG